MSYQTMAPLDQPIIPFTSKYEAKSWYIRVFNHAIWGDEKPQLYFEDGLSSPIVQYTAVKDVKNYSSRPVYARAPYRREIASCKFYSGLQRGSIIAYNGISGVSREGINWMTLCCRPILSFDPTPYFKGNTYLYPLSEGVRKSSIPSRFHLKTMNVGEDIKCNTELAVGRSYVLPSREAYDELFDAVYEDISSSVPDDVVLRRVWTIAYLFQPFELAQIALDASCRSSKGKDFVSWVKTAPEPELINVTELSEEVQNRIEYYFSLLYGVDDSGTGQSNRSYLWRMLRFIQRMLLTSKNENAASASTS